MYPELLRHLQSKGPVRNTLVMIGFGVLALLLTKIRFYIPGVSGGTSDLCEVAVLSSIIFLPHWIYIIGISFILALGIPAEGSALTTIMMHSCAGLFAWCAYTFIIKRISNVYYLSGLWALMVILYYFVFLLPVAFIGSSLAGMIGNISTTVVLKNMLMASRFEIFTSTSSTTLFLALIHTAASLKTKNNELLIALDKAKESDKLKSAFLANMSHEIRTPMNGIIGFTNLIIEPNLPDATKEEYGKTIINSSNQLLTIINNILDISRIESGSTEVHAAPLNLISLLANIESFYKLRAVEKKLNFEVINELPHEANFIITDKGKLQQIIDNLVNNAFKFTHVGFITLSCERDGELIKFSVKDSGIGIEPIHHERIFDRFAQVESKKGWNYGGTGLGLSITKALVELLGGRISLDSTAGVGTEFTFTIPYLPYSEDTATPAEVKQVISGFSRQSAICILIAEDETVNLKYLSELLSGIKAEILTAGNGEEAVQICKEHPEIDLVLMDIRMPVMNGIEATKLIRGFRPNLPVIAQTAYALNDDLKQELQTGFTDYIVKPLTKNMVLSIISKYMSI